MSALRIISRLLLVFEALLLMLPNLFGIGMFFIGMRKILEHETLYEHFTGYASLLALLTFYALWLLYLQVLFERFTKGKRMNPIIKLLTATGFVLSIAAIILFELSIKSGIEIFSFGILYVPTYLHLLLEIERQKYDMGLFNLSSRCRLTTYFRRQQS